MDITTTYSISIGLTLVIITGIVGLVKYLLKVETRLSNLENSNVQLKIDNERLSNIADKNKTDLKLELDNVKETVDRISIVLAEFKGEFKSAMEILINNSKK